MRKVRIALYGVPVERTRQLSEVIRRAGRRAGGFSVHCVPRAARGKRAADLTVPLDQLIKYNPHVVVIWLRRDELLLSTLLKQRIHFLLVVLTPWAEDRVTLQRLKRAGVPRWLINDAAITDACFAQKLAQDVLTHIQK